MQIFRMISISYSTGKWRCPGCLLRNHCLNQLISRWHHLSLRISSISSDSQISWCHLMAETSRDIIRVSLSSSWKVTHGSLEKCILLDENDDEQSELDIQDLVGSENCILFEPVDPEQANCDEGIESCQLTISFIDSEQDDWRFRFFSLLSSAKFVEVHGKVSREYITCLKGTLVEGLDDMVMNHYEHKLYPRPECFHLTLIPRTPKNPSIWLYGVQVKIKKFIGPPPAQEKPSSANDEFFMKMMCQMMTSKMNIKRR